MERPELIWSELPSPARTVDPPYLIVASIPLRRGRHRRHHRRHCRDGEDERRQRWPDWPATVPRRHRHYPQAHGGDADGTQLEAFVQVGGTR